MNKIIADVESFDPRAKKEAPINIIATMVVPILKKVLSIHTH